MATYWLSMHASYGCRHSGACCSSRWSIAVERDKVQAIASLQGDGRWLSPAAGAPPDIAGVLALGADGHCVFHRHVSAAPAAPEARAVPEAPAAPDPHCAIHRVLGGDALPAACQHFPRACLIDPRGVFVTLSHYCPTAAGLLFEHSGPVAIIEGPAANPHGQPEGLDARDALPPLLTTGVLMDLDAYSEWEAYLVRRLTDDTDVARTALPEQLLDVLDADARQVMGWRPGRGELREAVRALDRVPVECDASVRPNWVEEARLIEIVRRAVVSPQSWEPLARDGKPRFSSELASQWAAHAAVINRFLAAHAFASWMAYQGSGLDSIVRELRMALSVLRYEVMRVCVDENAGLSEASLKSAIRQTDLVLMHLADRDRLSAALR